MATFTAVKNRGGGRGALGGVLRYSQQDEKTLWEGRRLVSGWNCTAQSALSEMLLTKEQHRKTDGRQYKSFVSVASGTGVYSNGKIGGYELADDAVVYFIGNATSGYETKSDGTSAAISDDGVFGANDTRKSAVYTGKEIKNTWGAGSKDIPADLDRVSVLTQEINGFTYAKVVLIGDETGLPNVTTGSNYGYLTAGTFRTVEDGKTYLNYTIHTANGELKVKEENTAAPQEYPQGAVITYDVVSEGIVKNVNVVKSDMKTGKVTGWDGVDKIALDSYSTEIDAKDTTILYVDSDKMVGVEGGAIQKFADYNGNGIADANEPNNVRYVLSASGDYVVFLLVDVNNDMKANPASMSLSGDVNAAKIEAALTNGSADLDASGLTAGVSVTVKNGQTLNVTNVDDTYALNVTVESGATLKISDTTVDANMLVATVKAGGAVILADGTQLFGGNTAIQSNTVTVKGDADKVYAISSDAEVKVLNNTEIGAKDAKVDFDFTPKAALVGNATGVTIKFGANVTFTNMTNNFYNDTTDDVADGVSANSTYKWTTFTVSINNTDTQVTGWVKQ